MSRVLVSWLRISHRTEGPRGVCHSPAGRHLGCQGQYCSECAFTSLCGRFHFSWVGNRKRDCSDGALRNLVFIWYVSEVLGYLLGSRVTGIDCASERSSGQYRAWGQRDRRRGDWLGNRCFSVYLVADTAIFVTLQGTGLGHKVM